MIEEMFGFEYGNYLTSKDLDKGYIYTINKYIENGNKYCSFSMDEDQQKKETYGDSWTPRIFQDKALRGELSNSEANLPFIFGVWSSSSSRDTKVDSL